MAQEVQTRSDSYPTKYSGCHCFPSVAAAYRAYKEDSTIWKISWYGDAEMKDHYRFRPKYRSEKWHPTSEKRLCELSPLYRQDTQNASASPAELFWVRQAMIAPNFTQLFTENFNNRLSDEEFEERKRLDCLLEVLSDQEFREKYCQEK
jgi:hypothetical protein